MIKGPPHLVCAMQKKLNNSLYRCLSAGDLDYIYFHQNVDIVGGRGEGRWRMHCTRKRRRRRWRRRTRRRRRRRMQGRRRAPAAALCVKAAGELALLHHQVHNESSFSAKTNNCSRICLSGCWRLIRSNDHDSNTLCAWFRQKFPTLH